VQPNDTYESISKRFLLSDNFAKALQLHNQNHPRAGGEMANSGRLTPGEKIYIPQASVLEKNYGGAFSKAPPLAAPLPAVVPAGGTVPPQSTTPPSGFQQ
jgi:hypothetical protein